MNSVLDSSRTSSTPAIINENDRQSILINIYIIVKLQTQNYKNQINYYYNSVFDCCSHKTSYVLF